MKRPSNSRLIKGVIPLLLGGLLSASGVASDQDYFLSVPLAGGILRLDASTLTATPFATGIGIPFYGFHLEDGTLYVPDKELEAILRIDPLGGIHPVTAGNLLKSPVAIVRDPAGGIVATDLPQNNVVHVSFSGTQTLIHDSASSGGMLNGPGGLAFGPSGDLYIANNIGNNIVKIDPAGGVSLFSSSPLIAGPGGIAIDGGGNMFVAMYDNDSIVRFRLDTGEAEMFASSVSLMNSPNDLKLSRTGGLLTTTKFSNLLRIDPSGNITELFRDPFLGEIVGVAVPVDWDPCDGRFESYGQGKAGSGGFVPSMRGIFSPCPGGTIGLEWRYFVGGGAGLFIVGFQPSSVPILGGTLLVDLAPPAATIPLTFPGTGPGAGDLVLSFTLDNNPALVGLNVYFQTLAIDPGATLGVSMSNGLKETIGS